jgi:hypothetical protein
MCSVIGINQVLGPSGPFIPRTHFKTKIMILQTLLLATSIYSIGDSLYDEYLEEKARASGGRMLRDNWWDVTSDRSPVPAAPFDPDARTVSVSVLNFDSGWTREQYGNHSRRR